MASIRSSPSADRLFVAGGQEIGEIAQRDAQRADVRHRAIHAHLASLGG
jgi:hypothetical protein